jgi:selenide,water dikinase
MLGTGILSTAFKGRKGSVELQERVAQSMWTLNDVAGQRMLQYETHAATDITGFGLLGHTWEMAKGSQVDIHIAASRVPLFEEALDFAKRGYLTKGDVSNRDYTGAHVILDSGISRAMSRVLFDPQTSGGLLISLPPTQAVELVEELHQAEVTAAVIGEVEAGSGAITVTP